MPGLPSETPFSDNRDRLFEHLSRIGSAFSNAARLRLLSILSHGEHTLEDLAEITNQTPSAASAQLKVLRHCGLVTADKRGRFVWFRLANEEVLRFWLTFRDFSATQLPEVRELIRDVYEKSESLTKITEEELAIELKAGRVILLDLRPPGEYAEGHIPEAVNIPFSTLENSDFVKTLLTTPPSKALYAYCRGPWCVRALEGVKKLRAMGLPVERLNFSFPEWKRRSLDRSK